MAELILDSDLADAELTEVYASLIRRAISPFTGRFKVKLRRSHGPSTVDFALSRRVTVEWEVPDRNGIGRRGQCSGGPEDAALTIRDAASVHKTDRPVMRWDAEDLRVAYLGRIQEIRSELRSMSDRGQARELKLQALHLLESARGEKNITEDVILILTQFVDEARAAILSSFGTSGWDEPETREEALAKMLPLSPAPGNEVERLDAALLVYGDAPFTDERMEEILSAARSVPGPGQSWYIEHLERLVAEVRRLRRDRT